MADNIKKILKMLKDAIKDENDARLFYIVLTHELFDKVDSLRYHGMDEAADRVEEFARIINETKKQETEHGIAMFNIMRALKELI